MATKKPKHLKRPGINPGKEDYQAYVEEAERLKSLSTSGKKFIIERQK